MYFNQTVRKLPKYEAYKFCDFIYIYIYKTYPTLFRQSDGGKIVSPTHRPRSHPQKHYFSVSVIHLGAE
jgi:hypothetical protein